MDKENTEEKILQAAEKEFIEKGFAGTRMQEIANRAGINKALLHYYFRSKQKLFEMIFKTAFKLFLPKLLGIFARTDIDFEKKIHLFVEAYIDLITANPHIPGFIIHEISRQPSALVNVLQHVKPDLNPVKQQIQVEIDKGNIRNFKVEHLILNVLSLSVFPIVAAPIATQILCDGNQNAYKSILQERKQHVADFVLTAIRTKN